MSKVKVKKIDFTDRGKSLHVLRKDREVDERICRGCTDCTCNHSKEEDE